MQCIPAAVSLGLKRTGRKADQSALPSAGIKNMWSFQSSIRLHGAVRGQVQGKFLPLLLSFCRYKSVAIKIIIYS
jgi:hypothetical protein